MQKPAAERILERGLFASRWLVAPFYVGLIGALAVLLWTFVGELISMALRAPSLKPEDAILAALTLIDLSLAANLIIIVVFSGYENFVSKIDTGAHEDRPDWMGTVDFSGLKLKLIASIVAISGIALLKAFMQLSQGKTVDDSHLAWLVGLHMTFVVSGVLLAFMDFVATRTGGHGKAGAQP